jgi:hypothetical protein
MAAGARVRVDGSGLVRAGSDPGPGVRLRRATRHSPGLGRVDAPLDARRQLRVGSTTDGSQVQVGAPVAHGWAIRNHLAQRPMRVAPRRPEISALEVLVLSIQITDRECQTRVARAVIGRSARHARTMGRWLAAVRLLRIVREVPAYRSCTPAGLCSAPHAGWGAAEPRIAGQDGADVTTSGAAAGASRQAHFATEHRRVRAPRAQAPPTLASILALERSLRVGTRVGLAAELVRGAVGGLVAFALVLPRRVALLRSGSTAPGSPIETASLVRAVALGGAAVDLPWAGPSLQEAGGGWNGCRRRGSGHARRRVLCGR